ncbi:hypothetical protein [Megalodesulfovibrio gigas]|uniref:DUF697 domain-containing protein n=1 Tax=Megalodesulfovibrio gigas (strain ATCC 19364 / DSM 1382 / NCIMB 9332 / VKM B-1759) TaxID=1121448 RepID=T2G9I4_MEGG1|nr:hypothetical protein [Megalodesulfovibrio gigas]AGW12786.1 hypothetical protein DGI_0895 [Megalodesulfovibrio gigas DSM 1382 = ATCC 19364]
MAVEQVASNGKMTQAAVVISAFSAAHAVIAFALANTAIGDTVVLTGLTYAMIHTLGNMYGMSGIQPAKIGAKIFGLLAGVYLAGKLTFFLPGIGNWANAAATVFCTQVIGWTCVGFFALGQDPSDASKEELKEKMQTARANAHQYQAEAKEVAKKMTKQEREKIAELAHALREPSLSDQQRDAITQQIEEIYAAAKRR